MNIIDAIEDFRLALLADGRSQKTIQSYIYLNRDSPIGLTAHLARFGICDLSVVTIRHLRQYLVSLREYISHKTGNPLSPETISDFIRAAHRFFRWCAAEYGISDPMERIEFPRRTSGYAVKAVSLGNVRKLLDGCDDSLEGIRNRAIILMLIDTGCRAGGLCGLTSADIDLVSRTLVVVEKGSKPRLLSFSAQTAEAFAIWKGIRSDESSFFYTFRWGSPFTPDGLRHLLERLGEKYGIDGCVNPHSFRHAFAINYLRNGGDIASLSRLLGHAHIETTIKHYLHFTVSDLAARHEMFSPVKDVL